MKKKIRTQKLGDFEVARDHKTTGKNYTPKNLPSEFHRGKHNTSFPSICKSPCFGLFCFHANVSVFFSLQVFYDPFFAHAETYAIVCVWVYVVYSSCRTKSPKQRYTYITLHTVNFFPTDDLDLRSINKWKMNWSSFRKFSYFTEKTICGPKRNGWAQSENQQQERERKKERSPCTNKQNMEHRSDQQTARTNSDLSVSLLHGDWPFFLSFIFHTSLICIKLFAGSRHQKQQQQHTQIKLSFDLWADVLDACFRLICTHIRRLNLCAGFPLLRHFA